MLQWIKKEQNKYEQNIFKIISITDNLHLSETLKTNLDEKKKSLDTLNEQRFKRIILRSKVHLVKQSEKIANSLQV